MIERELYEPPIAALPPPCRVALGLVLATLLHRMVDDFLAYSAAEELGQPAR